MGRRDRAAGRRRGVAVLLSSEDEGRKKGRRGTVASSACGGPAQKEEKESDSAREKKIGPKLPPHIFFWFKLFQITVFEIEFNQGFGKLEKDRTFWVSGEFLDPF